MASGRIAADTSLAPLQHGLAELRRRVEPNVVRDGGSLLRAVAEALDAEIGRWEERSRHEPEARPVLRAFLAVRELLWELGVRVGDTTDEQEESPAEEPAELAPEPRVQRVAVQG